MLQIKNLSAGYDHFEVLHNVSISIGAGDIVALIGPNGAGKSTVLKSIMSLADKKEGRIFWKERDITNLPTHALLEEGIGFVPQGRLVFSSMTVRENLEMGGYLLHHKVTIQSNIEQVFSYFPALKKHERHLAGSLSGGEQQMLAIGRSLMMTPEFLMLDEPSLGLSPKLQHEVFEKLKEINAVGTTLLIVEQNVRLVLKYATTGYLLATGKVRFHGDVEEVGDEKLMHEAYLM
jgi:branched-chain amino acid transport system ATP-binding protein